MGLFERAHSYKGIAANHSLFSYPVLMGSDVVSVGKDQIQHVEIARYIAIKFNNAYGDVFKLPEYKVDDNIATMPGIDGQKIMIILYLSFLCSTKTPGKNYQRDCYRANTDGRAKRV